MEIDLRRSAPTLRRQPRRGRLRESNLKWISDGRDYRSARGDASGAKHLHIQQLLDGANWSRGGACDHSQNEKSESAAAFHAYRPTCARYLAAHRTEVRPSDRDVGHTCDSDLYANRPRRAGSEDTFRPRDAQARVSRIQHFLCLACTYKQ